MNKASERDVIESAKLERSEEIARGMLIKDMPIALIAEVTGLSEEYVLHLKSKL
jgi:hypothetical protein